VVERFDRAAARAELGLSPTRPVFAFVGQIRPYKGIETFLEAFALHVSRGLPGELVIAGMASDASYLAALRTQSAELRLEPVWFTRPELLPQRTVDLVISAATQVVLPFHEATQSGTAILALSHGRCVVSTTVGALPETVRDNGILVPPRNSHALADALALGVTDPARCDRLGAAARVFASTELSWRSIAARTAEIYAQALQREAGLLPSAEPVAG
jgi:glycosyltransferase involved in cell wall biosynthesis